MNIAPKYIKVSKRRQIRKPRLTCVLKETPVLKEIAKYAK